MDGGDLQRRDESTVTREGSSPIRLSNIPSRQRSLLTHHPTRTVLREARLRQCPNRRSSALRDRSRRSARTLHHPRRHRCRDPEDQSRNRSNGSSKTPPCHHSPDPRHTLQPASKASLPRTRHRRPDEPVTLRPPDTTPLQQTTREPNDHTVALELEHRQATELQRPLLYIEHRVPPGWPGETAGPADLLGRVRTPDAETHRGGGGRLDTALS